MPLVYLGPKVWFVLSPKESFCPSPSVPCLLQLKYEVSYSLLSLDDETARDLASGGLQVTNLYYCASVRWQVCLWSVHIIS